MDVKKTIVYIGNFNTHEMNAAGKRVLANAKLFSSIGYRVVLVGVRPNDKASKTVCETKQIVWGIESYDFPAKYSVENRYRPKLLFHQFKELVKSLGKIDVIIYYGSPSLAIFISYLRRFSQKNKCKLVADVVDWLNIETNSFFFDSIKRFDMFLEKAVFNARADGVIVISTYLKEYYKRSVGTTLLLPPLSWYKSDRPKFVNDIPVIMYAGFPFRKDRKSTSTSSMKDRLDLAVFFLYKAKIQGIRFVFHVFGLTEDDYLAALPLHKAYLNKLGDSIVFYGKVPMTRIGEELNKADYTILLRDRNRMTMAGFPTKVSESINAGVPVITTKTSDIEKYTFEGKSTFFVDLHNESSSIDRISAALVLEKNKRLENKMFCFQDYAFNINTYSIEATAFFNQLFDM